MRPLKNSLKQKKYKINNSVRCHPLCAVYVGLMPMSRPTRTIALQSTPKKKYIKTGPRPKMSYSRYMRRPS